MVFSTHITMKTADEPSPTNTSDAWFLLGVCFASALGEDYHHDGAVDPVLVRNARALVDQWRQWFPRRRAIRIHIDRELAVGQSGGVTASFYSGGIDSLHTATTALPRPDMLLSLEHRPLDEVEVADGFTRLAELSDYAIASGRTHLQVVTDVMTVVPEMQDMWAYLFHGPVLLAISHLFADRIGTAVLSSTHRYGALIPWGSHPLTDRLAGSSVLRAEHHGATFTRVEKTADVARDRSGLAALSVCGAGRLKGAHVNCSRCQKCLRTMITLDALGVTPDQAVTFDWSGYRPAQMAQIFLRNSNEVSFVREIIAEADRRGRSDIADACRQAIRRSSLFTALAHAELGLRMNFPGIVRYKQAMLNVRGAVYSALGLRRRALA